MQINSLDEAINLTMQKYQHSESQRKQIYAELEKGNFSVITSDMGARKFVINYYKKLNQKHEQPVGKFNNQTKSPFLNFNTLTTFFDQLLAEYHLSKESPETFSFLYDELSRSTLNQQYKNEIEQLLIEAASLYSKEAQQFAEVLREYNFNTIDITRKEACDITAIFGNMEHQRYQVTNALNNFPKYRQVLLNNLISYSYYEHDYSKSFEDILNEHKTNYK